MAKNDLEHLIPLLLFPGAAFAGLDYHTGLMKFEDQTQGFVQARQVLYQPQCEETTFTHCYVPRAPHVIGAEVGLFNKG